MKIEEEFGCAGYFGFGTGVDIVRNGPNAAPAGYCAGPCAAAADCWVKHRERARRISPEAMKIVDEITATGLRGSAVVNEYARRTVADDVPALPPDVLLMVANTEDGAAVAAGQKPKDRGPATLQWPFES